MQLDKTRIAVRERGVLDTLDLSLHVMRHYLGPLLITTALGVLPLMLINYWLIGWMLEEVDEGVFPFRFLWHAGWLVYLQAPLGSIFATSYLGQAVFLDRPRLRDVVRDVLRLMPRILWCQGLVRGVAAAWLLLMLLDRDVEFDFFLELFLPLLLLSYVSGLRAFRPFLNEIVLLERNPLASPRGAVITVGRRSRMLHAAATGDLFLRWLGAAWIGGLLALGTYFTLLSFSGVLWNDWSQGWIMLGAGFPAALWLTVLYLTVFRFLSYLDLRIRQEGWEVELRVRAEAARMAVRVA
jgi:hypothetical protein